MIVYCLMNPDVDHPYEHCLFLDGQKDSIESLKVFLEAKLTQHGPDDEFLQVSEWWQLENAFKNCAKFEPELRPSAHDVTAMLSKGKSFSASVEHVVPLQVSQASSLCEQGKIAAERLNSSNAISIEYENEKTAVDNGGTNSCAFLGLEIANQFLASKEPLEWSELKTTAKDVINNYPIVINQLRVKEELYEPIAAYSLMRNNNLINNCTLSEEFVGNACFLLPVEIISFMFYSVLRRCRPMESDFICVNHTHFLLASIGNHSSFWILIQSAVLWVVTGTAFYCTLKIQMVLHACAWFVGSIKDCWKVALGAAVGKVWPRLQSVSI